MPDNSPLATQSLIEHLRWIASAFRTVVYEIPHLPESGKLLFLQEMSELGSQSSERYARILENCVVMPLTDIFLEGDKGK